jgi:AcrR family transcriptional regulator
MEHNGSMQVTEDHRTRVAAERREKMRARLLEAALQIIADEGTAALSIDRLILQAGVSRGTFYKYYDAPQALVRELALGISNELISNAEPLVQLVDDPAVRIAVGLRALMHTCRAHPVLGHFLVHLGWQDLNQQHLMFDYVKRDLDQAQQLGRFGVIESDLALSLVGASALVGIQVMMKSPGQVPKAPEETTAAVLRALGMKDPEAQAIAHLPLPPIPLPETGLISRVTKMVKTERSAPG